MIQKFNRFRRKEQVEGILYILPYTVIWGLFLAWPMVYGFYISLHKWQPLVGSEFIGLENYISLFNDLRFWNAFKNTAEFALITIPLILFFGLAFALLLRAVEGHKGAAFIESSLFFPYLLNVAIISIVWKWLLDPDFGLINSYLSNLGLSPPTFLNNEIWVIPVVAFATAWWLAGYRMVIFKAALGDIPEQVYEMSRIDGANFLTRFFKITLPLLKPSILFSFVLTAISAFRVLGQIQMMTAGGPGRSSEVLALYLYREGWQYFNMGRAAAIGFILFLVILFFTLVAFKVLGFGSDY